MVVPAGGPSFRNSFSILLTHLIGFDVEPFHGLLGQSYAAEIRALDFLNLGRMFGVVRAMMFLARGKLQTDSDQDCNQQAIEVFHRFLL
jgi:hypothetical protein